MTDTELALEHLGGLAVVEGSQGMYRRETPAPEEEVCYYLVADGNPRPIQTYPRTDDGAGAINAIDLAARLSLHGPPVEVYVRDRLLARFEGGCRKGRTRPLRAPVKSLT